ncbi:MAG: hypothetical protein U5L00_11295 [Desulfovermiculus sp.]|nr:hypothetical protein [Desulfovermiculus sp.]
MKSKNDSQELLEDASDCLAQLMDIVSNMDSQTYGPVLDQAKEVMDRLNAAGGGGDDQV